MIKILCSLLVLLSIQVHGKTIRLDHTFMSFGNDNGGSSWGTDDTLMSQVDISESELPAVFKLPLTRPVPKSFKFEQWSVQNAHYFINNSIYVYDSINLCLDSKIQVTAGFNEALDLFLEHMIDVQNPRQKMNFQILPVETPVTDPRKVSSCDILMMFGSSTEYPFSHIKNSDTLVSGKIPQLLLGLYYRHSNINLPIIVFNPSIKFDFDSDFIPYIERNEKNEVVVDGRTLVFHELAHALGLDHIHVSGAINAWKASSIMGTFDIERFGTAYQQRFSSRSRVWKSWLLKQTSLYRHIFHRSKEDPNFNNEVLKLEKNKLFISACVMPGERVSLALQRSQIFEDTEPLKEFMKLPQEVAIPQDLVRVPAKESEKITYMYHLLTPKTRLVLMERFMGEKKDLFIPEKIHTSFFKDVSISDAYESVSFLSAIEGRISPKASGSFLLAGGFEYEDIRFNLLTSNYEVQEKPGLCYQAPTSPKSLVHE